MLSKNKIKNILKLRSKKYRKEYSQYIIEGFHGVEEVLKSSPSLVEEIYSIPTFIPRLKYGKEIYKVFPDEMAKISSQQNPEGVLAIVNMPEQKYWDYQVDSTIFYMEDIQNPSNLGTIIRSLDWFGYSSLLLSAHTVDEYNPKCVQASMGSIHHLDIYREGLDFSFQKIPDSIALRLTEMDAEDYKSIAPSEAQILVMGNESQGVSDMMKNRATGSLSVLGSGKAESLNIAVAQGILASYFSS